jgi:hypothetical protein
MVNGVLGGAVGVEDVGGGPIHVAALGIDVGIGGGAILGATGAFDTDTSPVVLILT